MDAKRKLISCLKYTKQITIQNIMFIIQQLGKHCNSIARYQAMSTHHIIPADKKVYIATYQPLKSTCVELKSVLTVLLAYPPHSSRSGKNHYSEQNIRPLEYFVALKISRGIHKT